jgi:hypothetical protein
MKGSNSTGYVLLVQNRFYQLCFQDIFQRRYFDKRCHIIDFPVSRAPCWGLLVLVQIEETRSKLRGMFCRAAVLRIDRKEFCLI